jgi:two-component SAPR family response regulator
MKNIMEKKVMDITLSNTIGMVIVKKRKIKCLHVLIYDIHNGSNLAKSTKQMSTFIFNMKKSFKNMLMKDTNGCVSHDGS